MPNSPCGDSARSDKAEILWLDGDIMESWDDLLKHLWVCGELESPKDDGLYTFHGGKFTKEALVDYLKGVVERNKAAWDAMDALRSTLTTAEWERDEVVATLTLSKPVPEWLLRLPPIEPLPDDPAEVKPGQVWLAKDVPGTLLVVESLENPDGYACYPIAEETAYLSDRDVWLDKGATRFGKPMMVQTWLDVPTDRQGLGKYIGDVSPETLQRVLRFRAGVSTTGDKHMSGPPLTSEDDPRYAYQRQQVEFWKPASARLTQRIFDADEIANLKAQRDEARATIEQMKVEVELERAKHGALRSQVDGNLPYLISMQQQTCKVCGRPMKFDFHVPDDVWANVVPDKHRNHAICLYCFDEYAHQAGVEYRIHELCFAGKAITLLDADEALASCAAMREALEAIQDSPVITGQDTKTVWLQVSPATREAIRTALSSPAGRDMLERLHKAEELLTQVHNLPEQCKADEFIPDDKEEAYEMGYGDAVTDGVNNLLAPIKTAIDTYLKRGGK